MLKTLNQKLKENGSRYQDLLLLILRISVALIFIRAGYGKLMHLDKTVMFFETLGIPYAYFNAVLSAITELGGGIFILIGLFTRFVSFPLAFIMLVAIATAQWREVTDLYDLVSLIEYLYLVIFLIFTSLGAGRFSFDALWLEKPQKKSRLKKK